MQSGVTPSEATVSELEAAKKEQQKLEYETNLRRSEEAIAEAEARDRELQQNPGQGQGVDQSQTTTPKEEEDDKVDTIGEVWDEVARVGVGGGLTRGAESTLTLGEKVSDLDKKYKEWNENLAS